MNTLFSVDLQVRNSTFLHNYAIEVFSIITINVKPIQIRREKTLRTKIIEKMSAVLILSILASAVTVHSIKAEEPKLISVLNELGFTNITELTNETFPAGIYHVTLYAEFAGYHASNELSWYIVGTEDCNLIFSGSEGGFGYVDPPLVKSFTAEDEFGLSFLSPEARYFTETYKNPDGIKHSMVLVNQDDPSVFLVGFENLLGGGDKDYQDMVISLDLLEPPSAIFTYSPSWPQVEETVIFNASRSSPHGGTIVNYKWNFGDGNVSTVIAPEITHHYATFGTYNVTLTVTDSEGLNNTVWQLVNVREHPQAFFTYFPSDPGTGETITFDASASEPNGGTIINYQWDFGDGNITETVNPIITHRYLSSGTYNVTVTVFDSEDKNDTVWHLVTVTTHDIAIVDVTPESDWLYKGKLCHANINVTVVNEGDMPESFTLTVYADNDTTIIGDEYEVGTQAISLLPDENKTVTFTWNTINVDACRLYIITATVSIVPHEVDVADNNFSSAVKIKVRIVGDVDGDGNVDIFDIARAALAFGATPDHPKWVPYGPYADITNDNYVNITDLVIIARNFGKSCK